MAALTQANIVSVREEFSTDPEPGDDSNAWEFRSDAARWPNPLQRHSLDWLDAVHGGMDDQ